MQWFALAAIVTGSQLLTGHPQYMWITLVAVIAFCAWRWRPRAGLRPLLLLAGAALLGALIGAVQLLPSAAIIKIDLARALLDTNNPENDREALRNLELAVQQESGSFELWRLMAAGYSKQNNPGMTSLARAEMAILRGQRAEAQSHAAAAERGLQPGTPAWQRAQDIKAYINSRPRR